MVKKQNILKYTPVCIIFGLLGAYAGYSRITTIEYSKVPFDNKEEVEAANLILEDDQYKEYQNNIRISATTEIVYEHYDVNSGETQTLRILPPNFMINKTQEDIKNSFTQWDIVSFEDEQVVMRRIINNKPNQVYTIGVSGEFIAIFYGEGNLENIKEVTNIPISALPKEEQERLKSGIPIYSQDELIRRLEDYSS